MRPVLADLARVALAQRLDPRLVGLVVDQLPAFRRLERRPIRQWVLTLPIPLRCRLRPRREQRHPRPLPAPRLRRAPHKRGSRRGTRARSPSFSAGADPWNLTFTSTAWSSMASSSVPIPRPPRSSTPPRRPPTTRSPPSSRLFRQRVLRLLQRRGLRQEAADRVDPFVEAAGRARAGFARALVRFHGVLAPPGVQTSCPSRRRPAGQGLSLRAHPCAPAWVPAHRPRFLGGPARPGVRRRCPDVRPLRRTAPAHRCDHGPRRPASHPRPAGPAPESPPRAPARPPPQPPLDFLEPAYPSRSAPGALSSHPLA